LNSYKLWLSETKESIIIFTKFPLSKGMANNASFKHFYISSFPKSTAKTLDCNIVKRRNSKKEKSKKKKY